MSENPIPTRVTPVVTRVVFPRNAPRVHEQQPRIGMKNTTRVTHAFIAGYFLHMGINSLAQDYLGKEAFIRVANAEWTDPSVSVPRAIVIVALSLFIFYLIRRSLKE